MINKKFNHYQSASTAGYTLKHVFKIYLSHFPLSLGLSHKDYLHFSPLSKILSKCALWIVFGNMNLKTYDEMLNN